MMKYSRNQWQVPTFEAKEFSEKSADYCVCIFVINEGRKLHAQLARMNFLSEKLDIVIADGGSTDRSTNLIALKEFGVNTLLVKTGSGKLGAQMRMAFAWSLDRGYKGIVVMDGNNKDSVEDIPNFIARLAKGFDHVQGSRFVPGGNHENTPLSRIIAIKVLHAPLIRLASGFRYTDTTNGFRAYSRRFLQDTNVSVFRDIFSGYELHYYLAIRAAKLGFKCIEIPVSRIYPKTGKMPTKISPVRGNLQVIKKLLFVVIGKYNPTL